VAASLCQHLVKGQSILLAHGERPPHRLNGTLDAVKRLARQSIS